MVSMARIATTTLDNQPKEYVNKLRAFIGIFFTQIFTEADKTENKRLGSLFI